MSKQQITKPNRDEKKTKRKEILEKKKAMDQLIKSASALDDHIALFPPFRTYNRNGLSVRLESGRGDMLSSPVKQYIQNLIKVNMEAAYGSEWPAAEKVKRREMVDSEARYIFVHNTSAVSADGAMEMSENDKIASSGIEDVDHMVGFVHYRFTVEEEIPVLYVYELQLENGVRGKALGKLLMQLIELIAHKSGMGAVVLTVQKANITAMNFYLKLRYIISSISPSRVDPLHGTESSYEILCKAFDREAIAVLK